MSELNNQPTSPMDSPTIQDSLLGIIGVLYRWRKKIVYFTGGVGLVSILILFLLPNYYSSQIVFFPANDEATSKGALFGNGEAVSDIGGAEMVDRVLTYANSRGIVDYMIQKFGLFRHYDIDSTKRNAFDQCRKEFLSHYSVTKNEYGAIEIAIEDTDIFYPLPMVKEAVAKIDEMYYHSIASTKSKTIDAIWNTLQESNKKLSIINDSLQRVRKKFGIYNIETQGESLSMALITTEGDLIEKRSALQSLQGSRMNKDTIDILRAKVKGLEERYKSLTQPTEGSLFDLNKFGKGRELVVLLESERTMLVSEIQELSLRYAQFKTSLNVQKSIIIPSETPEQPKSKSRPKRLILSLGILMLAFVTACGAAIFFDATKNINWKKILSDTQ